MVAQENRAPWWQWALLSVTASVLMILLSLGAVLLLWVQGLDPLDLLDYVELSRPPFIRDGGIAATFALLLAGQAVAPLITIPFFRPARQVAFAWWRSAPDRTALLRRVGLGLMLALAVQGIWALVAPPVRSEFQIVEKLAYAVAGGGRFWPRFWLVLVVGLVIPVAEEVLFRGLLFGLLRRRWGFGISAVASAVLFGLPHGPANALPVAILGLFLAWQVEQDKSLFGAMLLHGMNNVGALLWVMGPHLF